MKRLLSLFIVLMPWRLRRVLLVSVFKYEIHPTARIGFAWIFPKHLKMSANAHIGNLTVCRGMKLLHLEEAAWIGNLNWITGFPAENRAFFEAQADRNPQLLLKEHAAITNRHLIDCTDSVTIGKFTTFAGFRSQILTHSIDLPRSVQVAKPVSIGDYCFVGTGSIILAGAVLPSYSVLGAGSVLNKAYADDHYLYAGNPARPVKPLSEELKYFTRTVGFVH